MSLLREAAALDFAIICGIAIGYVARSAFSTLFCYAITFGVSLPLSWVFVVPVEAVEMYPIVAVGHLFMFKEMEETKEFFSAFWTLLARDAPPGGLPGVEIANIITKGLLLLFYILVSLVFHNIWPALSFLYYCKLWVFSLLTAFVVLCITNAIFRRLSGDSRRGKQKAYEIAFALMRQWPVKLGFAIYNVPLLSIELWRNGWAHLAELLRPLMELYRFRKPMLLYKHARLNSEKREIRLIELKRRLPATDISCTLTQFPLNEAPPYEAISYTWGSGIKDHLIFFNHKWLPTTRNVHKLLHDRCSYARTRWIWIDAVCIDQDDLEEKKVQIELMGEIYRTADRVVIWLDDREITHTELTEATFLLELINFNSFDVSSDLYEPPTRVLGHYSHWQSLNRLLSHPYWHRVWIVQEVAMAKTVHVLYGNKYIAWDHLYRMVATLNIHPVNVMVAIAHQNYKLKKSKIMQGAIQICLIETLRKTLTTGTTRSLANCISITQKCAATDPRDKIFALHSLVEWPASARADQDIKVNYKLEVWDVYEYTARYLLKEEPQFVLSFAGIGWERITPKLRSWVPDFASLPLVTRERNINLKARYRAGSPGSVDILAKRISTEALPTIAVQAVLVSEISHVSSTTLTINPSEIMSISSSRAKSTRLLLREACNMVDKMPSTYAATGQSTEEALWRTLIEDRHVTKDSMIVDHQMAEKAMLREYKRPASPEYGLYFMASRKTLLTEEDGTRPEFVELDQEAEDMVRKFQFNCSFNFSRAFTRACQGQNFAVTKSGLMGIVPPGTKVGDILCIIPWFEKPVLLRSKPYLDKEAGGKEKYQLVGVCYVHGIMDGEALKNSPSTRTFIIE